MNCNVFQTSDALSAERLTWIADILNNYPAMRYQECHSDLSLNKTLLFYFFITGDALNSLIDGRCCQKWENILSFPFVRCIYSERELFFRGIDIESFKNSYPGQIIPITNRPDIARDPYWEIYLETTKNEVPAIGVLHLYSPYMSGTTGLMMDLLATAVDLNITPELYTYLDGVHVTHRDQDPALFENVGVSLDILFKKAQDLGLEPVFVACSRCARARGYTISKTRGDEALPGPIISSVKIKNLDEVVHRFMKNHQILSTSSFSLQIPDESRPSENRLQKHCTPPALVILITHTPYGTEITFGAISFAVACAYHEIQTSVIFIEDGVYTLIGKHAERGYRKGFNMQEIILATADMPHLNFYSYIPSFKQRGFEISYAVEAVRPIDEKELAHLVFYPPASEGSRNTRVIFF